MEFQQSVRMCEIFTVKKHSALDIILGDDVSDRVAVSDELAPEQVHRLEIE